jgi:hypothetical protein
MTLNAIGMKKIITLILLSLTFLFGCKKAEDIISNAPTGLSDDEIVQGLKDALEHGTDTSVNLTHKVDGYFKNTAIKILLPPEAQLVESTLRGMGLGSLCDDAILSLNRAAEDAAVEAKPIFWNAITSMTISDGKSILKGDSTAATTYLKTKTDSQLFAAFKPKIQNSLTKVNATKYWNDLFTTYNKIPLVTPVNPNLENYATQKALDGLFHEVGNEEKDIRRDPAARVDDTLKKVFGSN